MSEKIGFEIPRRAVPDYLKPVLGDRHDPGRVGQLADDIPPGHRFLLFFHAMADIGEAYYERGAERERQRMLRNAAEGADWVVFKKEIAGDRAALKKEWSPLKNGKRIALQAAAPMGKTAAGVLKALALRQQALSLSEGWQSAAELTSPLITGSGNPHPVENGFAFLSPYGVPYLAGSGVKGVLRRAAEELALLSEDASGWTLPLVWALFGFDENSACLHSEKGGDWVDGYNAWVNRVSAKPDPVLEGLMHVWVEDNAKQTQHEFLERLASSSVARRAIHFQGLLAVEDAFPDHGAQMGVDILNPHHKNYYQGNESPHDGDPPIPVFFLVLEPGAKFTLRARALPGRELLWAAIGDWKKLLDAAFQHAADWMGFGAKTSVGYGALVADRQKELERLEQETRKRKEAEEQAAADAASRAEEEERRRREEEWAAEDARQKAAFDALPESEKAALLLSKTTDDYLGLSERDRKASRGQLNKTINGIIESALLLTDAEEREKVAGLIEEAYEKAGWADPGGDKKKRNKQEARRRDAVEAIRSGKPS